MDACELASGERGEAQQTYGRALLIAVAVEVDMLRNGEKTQGAKESELAMRVLSLSRVTACPIEKYRKECKEM